jgi:hypothetical protein
MRLIHSCVASNYRPYPRGVRHRQPAPVEQSDGTIDGKRYDPGLKTWIRTRDLKARFTAYERPYLGPWNGRWIAVIP